MHFAEIEVLKTSDVGVPPHNSPELSKFREMCRKYDKEWVNLQGTITGSGGNKPIQIEIDEQAEQITEQICEKIEGNCLRLIRNSL